MSGASPGAEQGASAEAGPTEVEPSEDGEIRIRALDFAQPTKFTVETRRRLTGVLGPCCETLTVLLANELKADVEVELSETSQHTWAAARAELPADSVAVAIGVSGAEDPQMLLSVELPWALQALECLLGGEAQRAPASRRLTDLDRKLVEGLLDQIVAELSAAWVELGGPELVRGQVDLEGDAGLLVAPGEPTLSINIATRIEGADSGMSLLLPWTAFAPLAESAQGKPTSSPTPAAAKEADDLRRGLAAAPVLLRAEIGSAQMPIERMLALQPGTLLELGERSEDGVHMFAGEVSVARGRPGRSGARRAVKIEVTGEPPTRAETYATLGRGELERARAWAQGERDGGDRPAVLQSIFVRVWAELGRTHISLGEALELAAGAVVELDQTAETPVELFANGLCFANGSLVVSTEGAWGVQVEALM
jgi:flagellar motor switch protein FliM